MATYQDSRYNIALPSGAGGALVHIKTLTASSSGDLSFVDGSSDVVLDNTYRTYIFKWINIHPSNNDTDFTVNFRDGGSNYDATKTTTYFRATQSEDGSTVGGQVGYETAVDLAQSTGVQKLSKSGMGSGNDECASGEMYLFNPSSTTFVKHFLARNHYYGHDDQSSDDYIAGYCNVTAAIDGVQFAMNSGNIDAGTIKLYGIA